MSDTDTSQLGAGPSPEVPGNDHTATVTVTATATVRELSFLGRARGLVLSAVVLVAGLIGVQEATKIVASIEINSQTFSPSRFNGFVGPGSRHDAFVAWNTYASQSNPEIVSWLRWGIYLDLLVMVGYTGLILGLRERWHLRGTPGPDRSRAAEIPAWSLILLVGADVAEDVLSWFSFGEVCPGGTCGKVTPPDVLLHVAAACTVVKWLAAVVLIALAVYVAFLDPHRFQRHPPVDLGARVRRGLAALQAHRFAFLVLVALGLLLLLPAGPVFVQAIDIERSWLLTTDPGRDVLYLVCAVLSAAVLTCALVYLCGVQSVAADELRSTTDVRDRMDSRRGWPGGVIWIAIAAAVVGVTALLRWAGAVQVHWPSVGCVGGVLAAVGLLTMFTSPASLPEVRQSRTTDESLTRRVGCLLAYSVMTALLLGLARAFLAPLILGQYRLTSVWTIAAALVAVGLWVVVSTSPAWREPAAVFPRNAVAAGRRVTRVGKFSPQSAGARKKADGASLSVSLLPSGLATAVLGGLVVLWPVWVSRTLGGLAVVMLGAAALTTAYTTLLIIAQLADPPRLFRVLGFRRTPLIGLVAIIALASTFASSATPAHLIRRLTEPTVVSRPSVIAALDSWLAADHPGCTIPLPVQGQKSVSLRPMVFVATEGGGARAAWWTVRGMDAMTATACGGRNIVVTSGVSGGAIGLAVSAVVKATDSGASARSAMESLADQSPLASVLDGLLSRDLFAGLSGMTPRAFDSDDPFPDRATLLEQTWERELQGLQRPFPLEEPPPWHTVFNGTSTSRDCRVLTGDIDLGAGASSCQNATVPGAYDLLRAYPCLNGAIRTSTAALLAARFPYVTPSGAIAPCHDPSGAPVDQVIDGGYAENSGLDTVDGLLAAMMPRIRAWNGLQLHLVRAELVVPVVVFLHNTPTAAVDVPAPPSKPTPEILVPPTEAMAHRVLGESATLLQRFEANGADWLPAANGRSAIEQAAEKILPSQSVTIAPDRDAQLEFPLGWSLSEATRRALDTAFDDLYLCSEGRQNASVATRNTAQFDRLFPC